MTAVRTARTERRHRRRAEPTFLRYVPGNSLVHRLDARTKLLTVMAVTAAVAAKPGWRQVVMGVAFVVIGIFLGRIPRGAIPRVGRGIVSFLIFATVLALWAGGAPYVHLGVTPIGLHGLIQFARVLGLITVGLGIALLLAWTTPLAEVAPAVRRLERP